MADVEILLQLAYRLLGQLITNAFAPFTELCASPTDVFVDQRPVLGILEYVKPTSNAEILASGDALEQ